MMKAADKAESLRADMKKLEETKIPTEDYKEISVQIEKAEQKFNRLLEKQEQMQREGKDNGTAWQRLNDQMDEIGNEIRYAKGELQDLVDTGKAFTLGSGTDAYVNMANQLKYTENNLSTLAQQHEVLETQQKNISTGYKKWGDIVKKSFNGVYNVLKKANDRVKSFGTWIKNIAQRHMPSLRKETERTSGTMSRFGKRLKSLLSGIFIFNVISSGFRSMFAVIKEGYENLYKGNKKFENSVDNLKASALTLKNALAAAFSPLVQIAIPYIQKVIEWMTKLADSVGQFIAAITGQKTYLRAVKQTTAAIKEQTKAKNKQLSSLDKLNNLTSSKDSSGDTGSGGAAFEEVPIDSKFQDIADKVREILDKIKGVLKKLFDPIKEAWDRVGNKVIKAWKYALDEVWKLIKDIGRDFLEVWNQEATIRMLEDVLRIIQHIGTTIGNLARQFRLAWNENDVGLHILENIRDIIAIIIHNIQVAAAYTALWAGNLDFYPLLDKLNQWLESFKPVVEAVTGILLDFYTKVILPLSKWVLEKGLPDLLQVFIDFNNKVDWESLRENLAEFWAHLEPFAETVGAGLIEFIDRCAQALANFLNSQEFKDFLEEVEEWMDSVSPDDVADALENIAKGLIALKLALLGYSAVKAVTSVLSTVKAFLSFFGVGGGAAETASTMETVATSSGTLATALGDLFTVLGGAAAFDSGIKNKLFDLIEILTGDTETVDKLRERYGELGGTVGIVKDTFSVAGNTLQGYGAVISDSVSLNDALEKAMDNIANGAIYTDEQLSALKEKFGATNEDIEMLRQSTLDANPILTEMADTFGLYDATPQTLQNIAAGLGEIASTGDLSIETLNGMTQEAQNFFNQQTIDGFDYFIGKLNEVDASADNLNQGMDLVSTSIEENSERIKEAANNIGGGLNSGIESAEPESAVSSFFDKVKNALCNIFGIHSPATQMVPFGEYITLGVLEGFANKFSAFTAPIQQLCTLITSGLSNGLKAVANAWSKTWSTFPNIVQSVINNIIGKISSFISTLSSHVSRIQSTLSNIGNVSSGLFGGGVKKTSRASAYAYTPAAAAVANLDIPGYATGQVIPKTMKKHLAYLGDNNQETEVVSPLSTIQQALREEMASSGFDGGGITVRVPVEIDGNVIMEIVKKLSREELKRTGKPAFT